MLLEHNVVLKDPRKVELRFASCYPNLYRSAMSSLGYHIIYDYLNSREDVFCERVIYPHHKSLETGTALKEFDVVGFSLQYEQDYFHVLEMLDQGGVPLHKKDRNSKDPLVMGGGPCASSNPLPLSSFVDLFLVGEAEVMLDRVLDLCLELEDPRKEIESFLEIEGVYLPYNPVKMAVVESMDDAWQPIRQVYPQTTDKKYQPAFGPAFLLGVSRGCTRGCRFCMAGCMYRPRREASLKSLLTNAEKCVKATGLGKVALIGAAVSDYSQIDQLCRELQEMELMVTTPSLRIESVKESLLKTLKKSGLKTVTLAPESIWRVRKIINKPINDDNLFNVVETIFRNNMNVKLYFMLGLPGETRADLDELVSLIKGLRESSPKKGRVKISVNPFIPKPHTPFQWADFDFETIKTRMEYLYSNVNFKDVKLESTKKSLIQYVLSMGNQELGNLINKSLNKRIPLKEWEKQARKIDLTHDLPWRNIDVGVTPEFLSKEYQKAMEGDLTPWCEAFGCYECGACEKKIKQQ